MRRNKENLLLQPLLPIAYALRNLPQGITTEIQSHQSRQDLAKSDQGMIQLLYPIHKNCVIIALGTINLRRRKNFHDL